LRGAASSDDVVLTYIQVSGPKLVDIWGYCLATTVQYFIYKGPPCAKIFQKLLVGLLF